MGNKVRDSETRLVTFTKWILLDVLFEHYKVVGELWHCTNIGQIFECTGFAFFKAL